MKEMVLIGYIESWVVIWKIFSYILWVIKIYILLDLYFRVMCYSGCLMEKNL